MDRKKIIIIAGLILGVFLLRASGQEDWGSPVQVWEYPGGWVNSANPTFYPGDFVCFEDIPFGENTYKLFHKPLLEWLDPILIPSEYINSDTFHTISPFVSFDGDRIYFASTRPGGYGGLDIWASDWDGVMWAEPQNLGPNINSEINEFGASLTLNEDEIYFSRVEGDYDGWGQIEAGTIFYSRKVSDEWLLAEPLPEPININGHAWEPSITADGQKLYFSARRPENPSYYFAYVSDKIEGQWSEPEALNGNINHLMWCPWDSSYWGDVPSVSTDSSGTALLFTYWPASDCPDVWIRVSFMSVGINDEDGALPTNVTITAYPNPFNEQTVIGFMLPERTSAEVSIYDIGGRLVKRLFEGRLDAGEHEISWKPNELSSGIYFANIKTVNYDSSEKLVFLK